MSEAGHDDYDELLPLYSCSDVGGYAFELSGGLNAIFRNRDFFLFHNLFQPADEFGNLKKINIPSLVGQIASQSLAAVASADDG